MKRLNVLFSIITLLALTLFGFQNCTQPVNDELLNNNNSSTSANNEYRYFSPDLKNNPVMSVGKKSTWSRGTGQSTNTFNTIFTYPATVTVTINNTNPNTNPLSSTITEVYNLDDLKDNGCQVAFLKKGTLVSSGENYETRTQGCFSNDQFTLALGSIIEGRATHSTFDYDKINFKYDTRENTFIERADFSGSGSSEWSHVAHHNIITQEVSIQTERTNPNLNPTNAFSTQIVNLKAMSGCNVSNFSSGTLISDDRSFNTDLIYCVDSNQLVIKHQSTIDSVSSGESDAHMIYQYQ